MNDSSPDNHADRTSPHGPDHETEALAVLIGRLVDGEADASDRGRFEAMAGESPALWEQLARHQQEMAALTRQFEQTVIEAAEVEVPGSVGAPARIHRWSRVLAVSGWAAVLALGLLWAVTALLAPRQEPLGAAPIQVQAETAANLALSPDEHMKQYLSAPNVLGELSPVVLEVEPLSDGRTAIRYLRRIEEFIFVDPDEELPVTDRGRLSVDPAVLRKTVPRPPRSD